MGPYPNFLQEETTYNLYSVASTEENQKLAPTQNLLDNTNCLFDQLSANGRCYLRINKKILAANQPVRLEVLLSTLDDKGKITHTTTVHESETVFSIALSPSGKWLALIITEIINENKYMFLMIYQIFANAAVEEYYTNLLVNAPNMHMQFDLDDNLLILPLQDDLTLQHIIVWQQNTGRFIDRPIPPTELRLLRYDEQFTSSMANGTVALVPPWYSESAKKHPLAFFNSPFRRSILALIVAERRRQAAARANDEPLSRSLPPELWDFLVREFLF